MKYVFIANSNKLSKEERESRNKVYLPNFYKSCVEAAVDLEYEVYVGINREKPEQLSSDLNVKFYNQHIYRNIFSFKDNFVDPRREPQQCPGDRRDISKFPVERYEE
jgi:hypothetical protein